MGIALIIYKNTEHNFNGSVINPPEPAPDFTLTNQFGKSVSLSQYRGKYVWLFFGYSHCTTNARQPWRCSQRHAANWEPRGRTCRYCSSPPIRLETRAVDERFSRRFRPDLCIWRVGTQAQLQTIWEAYGVSVEDGGETHSSYTYLIDPSGKLRMTLSLPEHAGSFRGGYASVNAKAVAMRKAVLICFLICWAIGMLIAIPIERIWIRPFG